MKHYIIICIFTASSLHVAAQSDMADTIRTQKIEEVTVKGAKKEKGVGMIRQTQEQLRVEMAADMTDLVRYMPSVGVSIAGTRGGMRGFAIRGVEANRVAISIDGILQPEVQDNIVFSSYGLSNASRIDFDPYFASSVEIQKGANSFISGTGALGGAVNYTTKEVADMLAAGKNYGVLAHVGYNGKENMRVYMLGGGLKWKKFEGLLMAAHRRGEALRNFAYGKLTRNITSTQADPMNYKQTTWLGKLSYRPGMNHLFTFTYYGMNRLTNAEIWTQEPIDIFTSEGQPYFYSHDQSLSHSYSLFYRYVSENHFIRRATVMLNHQKAYLDATTWSEYYRPNFDANGDMRLVYEGKRNKYRGQETSGSYARFSIDSRPFYGGLAGRHTLSVVAMATLRNNESRNVDEERPMAADEVRGYTVRHGVVYPFGKAMGQYAQAYSFLRPVDRMNLGFSLMDDISWGNKFGVKAGVRYDYFKTTGAGQGDADGGSYIDYLLKNVQGVYMDFSPISNTESGFSWIGMASYKHSDRLHVSYRLSTGFRVANTEEKYFQYYSTWPSFVVMANRALKPEKSYNNELEFSGRAKGVGYMLSLYYNRYTDFIELEQGVLSIRQPLSETEKSVSYVKNVNRKSADLKGFDASLQVYPGEWMKAFEGFAVSGAFSYAKGRSSHGTDMLGVQPLTGNVGVEYTDKDARWQAVLKSNMFFGKSVDQTNFLVSTPEKGELKRRYPSSFLKEAYIFDLYGYYKVGRKITLRAGVYNIFNTKYWRWDDLRQLTAPAMLSNIDLFFRDGKESITRFSRPKRYVAAAIEFKL